MRIAVLSLRQTVRRLRQHPLQACSAILILALGLGLTTASESIIYGLYHRPLPFPSAHRLVRVEEIGPHQENLNPVSYEHYLAWTEEQTAFQELVAWYPVGVAARASGGGIERYSTTYITPNVFRALGIEPARGRNFMTADAHDGSEPVAIISDELWAHGFAGDPQVVGKLLWVSGKPFTVVGVMPRGFRFPAGQRLWLPLTPAAQREMIGLPLQVFGRLQPGVSSAAAAAQLHAIVARRPSRVGDETAARRALIAPYAEGYMDAELRGIHLRMLIGVGCLLFIACANVASLLMARTIPRTGEFATRAAVGASRRQLFAESFMEPALLCGAGGLLAAAGAYLVTEIYATHYAATRWAWELVSFDGQSVGFTVGAAIACTLFAGAAPGFLAAAPIDLGARLREVSRPGPSPRFRAVLHWMLAAQVALSLGLLITTGVTVKSLTNVLTISPGFPTDHLLTGYLSVYRTQQLGTDQGNRLISDIVRRVAALPGVRSVAFADSLPIRTVKLEPRHFVAGPVGGAIAPATEGLALVRTVSVDYFESLGLRRLAGRTFTILDNQHGSRTAVVTRSFAQRVLGGASAVGRSIQLQGGWNAGAYDVVGVVSDSLFDDIGGDPRTPGIYLGALQFPQDYARYAALLVRTSIDPLQVVAAIKSVVAQEDPDAEFGRVMAMDQSVSEASETYRLASLLFMVLGASAFAIVMAGIYAIAAFSAASRTFELSVRLALGAQGRQILVLLVSGQAVPLGVGIGVGTLLAFLLSSSLRSLLFKSEGWDPAVVGVVLTTVALCGFVASLAPARRALSAAPVEILKRGG